MLSALLAELEGLAEGDRVVVIGTSNSDRELDSNVKRVGRFEKEIILELPGHKEREVLIQGLLSKIPNTLNPETIHELNLRMNGFTNGEIKQIVR